MSETTPPPTGTDQVVEPNGPEKISRPSKPPVAPTNSTDREITIEVQGNLDPQKTGQEIRDELNKLPDPETVPEQPKQNFLKRVYRENLSFFSDLYRLRVKKMLQWKGWTEIGKNAPRDDRGNLNDDWFFTEHCHYFHTTDSNGKEQQFSQPVGQHKHRVEVIRDPNDRENIISVKCVSGPLKEIITTKFGRRQKVWAEDPHDDHRHDMEYLRSNKLARSSINVEAAKVMGRVQAAGSTDVVDDDGKRIGKLEIR